MKNGISIEVLALKRLREIDIKRPKVGIIPFPEVFSRIPYFLHDKETSLGSVKVAGGEEIDRDCSVSWD